MKIHWQIAPLPKSAVFSNQLTVSFSACVLGLKVWSIDLATTTSNRYLLRSALPTDMFTSRGLVNPPYSRLYHKILGLQRWDTRSIEPLEAGDHSVIYPGQMFSSHQNASATLALFHKTCLLQDFARTCFGFPESVPNKLSTTAGRLKLIGFVAITQ